jgi:hypothetical protein
MHWCIKNYLKGILKPGIVKRFQINSCKSNKKKQLKNAVFVGIEPEIFRSVARHLYQYITPQ